MTILAANDSRLYACVYNNSPNFLYLAWGPAASLSTFTVKLSPNGGFYEVPSGKTIYIGQLSGIWGGTGGNAQVTEAV